MRLRLLIDVLWDENKIPGLQGMVADQAPVVIVMSTPGFPEMGGRLMGAQAVETEQN